MALKDPFLTPWFSIEFQGVISGAFRECSGFGSSNEVTEVRQSSSDGKHIIKKIPGNLKWNDITLKMGMTDNMDLWKWRKMIEDGNVGTARKNGSIVMYAPDGKEVARWNLVNAWPSSLSGPSANASSNEIAVEELVITHEGYERVK